MFDVVARQSRKTQCIWLCIAGTYTKLKYYLQDTKKKCKFAYLEERERGNVRTTLTRAKEGIIHKTSGINFPLSFLN